MTPQNVPNPDQNPDKILGHLTWARFHQGSANTAYAEATKLADAELKRFHDKSNHDSKRPGPGHYPAARLLQAYALTGMRRYDEAQAIIDEEIERQRLGCNEQTYFFLCHYQGLEAVIAQIAQKSDAPADLANLIRWEPFGNLLQDLTERSYYLLKPVSSDAYEMPQYL